MNFGITAPDVIDELAYDPDTEEMVLVIRADGDWTSNLEEKIELLKDKIGKYLTFAFAGQLAAEFPEHKDLNVRLQLECAHAPPAPMMDFFSNVDQVLAGNRARFVVNHTSIG